MERRQRKNYRFDKLCERNDFEEEVNGQVFQADGMTCSKVLKWEGVWHLQRTQKSRLAREGGWKKVAIEVRNGQILQGSL